MIDYEITVNASNLTHEEKKRVQDAFFKLGFAWRIDGANYSCLNRGCYTNTTKLGKVTQNIMWTDASTKPTHTVDELLELAGMKTKADLKPFDLEKALAGEPVVTRDRLEDVTQLTPFETSRGVTLVGVMAGNVQTWTKNGEFHESGKISDYDLFMKPKTRVINGFEVPAPESEPLEEGDKYYISSIQGEHFYCDYIWSGDHVERRWLKRGLVFLTKEDAIANAKAMSGVNPYGGCNE